MKRRIAILVAAVALCLGVPQQLLAGEDASKTEKPSISATQQVQVVTIVEAINYETREVTLKGPEGNTETVIARNTPNLEEVKVGDRVDVEYLQNVTIDVFANDGTEPGEGLMTAKAVNTPDQAPGGMEMSTRVITATVAEINLEANTFKLNMPGGEVREFTARNPENLKRAEVGDLVVITFTEAVAAYLVEVAEE